MKVCVVGAGALGSAVGGTFTDGGCDAWLIDQFQTHNNAINQSGLQIEEGGVTRTVRVGAATTANGISPIDLVIVLVKSFLTTQTVKQAMSVIDRDTLVMSLQNGLGHEDIIADVVGRERVLAGKTLLAVYSSALAASVVGYSAGKRSLAS